MRHDVTIVYRTPTGTDRYGGGVLEEASRATVPGLMQMRGRDEASGGVGDSSGFETTIVTWLLIVNPSYRSEGSAVPIVPPDRLSQILWDGRTFESEGGAMIYEKPPHGVHHYEVALKEVAA
jgi:hypothetical protein